MTRDEDRALEALEALGKSVRASVRRARRVRDRLGEVGVRVLDEVVSQLSRRPVHTRSKDLFRRAQQLKDRVLETFPGPGPKEAPPSTRAPRPPAGRAPAGSAPGARPPAPPPPKPAAPRPAASVSARDPGSEPSTPAPTGPRGPAFVGLSANEASAPSGESPRAAPPPPPAVQARRPGAALIADASGAGESDAGAGLRLLARDPAWGYVSWEIELERIGAAAAGMSRAEARLEVCEVDAAGSPALAEPVAPARGRYFFRWPCAGRRYRAVLYIAAADGRRVELARSRDVQVPEAGAPAEVTAAAPEFAAPDSAAARADAAAPPAVDRPAAAALGWSADPARSGPAVGREASSTSWSGGASRLPTSWSGGASRLSTSWSGGASRLSTSWSGGASRLSSSWSGGASRLSSSGGAPSSWSRVTGLFPTSWSVGGPSSGPTSAPSSRVTSGAGPSSVTSAWGPVGSAPWSSHLAARAAGSAASPSTPPSPADPRPHGPRPGPVARIPELVAQTPAAAGSRLVPMDEAARMGLLDPE